MSDPQPTAADMKHTITTAQTDLADLQPRFTEWLSDRIGERVGVSRLQRPDASGMSSVSMLADAEWNHNGTPHRGAYVVRMAPEPSAVPVFSDYDLQRQFDTMAGVAAHSDVPVPQVHWVETSPDVLGQPFLVMDRLDGAVPADNPPYVFGGVFDDLDAAERSALQDASVDVLATIHAITEPAARFPSLMPEAGLRAHFDAERRYYRNACADDGVRIPILEEAFDWLDEHWPARTSKNVLCWGDARVGNIMYDRARPTGVLDWESAWIAPAELDLGWFICFHAMFQDIADTFGVPGLPAMFRRDDVLRRYERTSGTTPQDMDFYLTYAALRHGTVMARIHRRRMHFGEAEDMADKNGYVMHHRLLRRLLDGEYHW